MDHESQSRSRNVSCLSGKTSFEFTSPNFPKLELQSEGDAKKYLAKLSNATRHEDLFAELAYVMAARHNLTTQGASINDWEGKRKLVLDLIDKATLICFFSLGREKVLGYAGNDLSLFSGLLSEIDDEVAGLDLEPEKHGALVLEKLREQLAPRR